MQIHKMKYFILIISQFTFLLSKAQYEPLFPYFFSEQSKGIEIVDDKLIFLHLVSEYPDFGSSLTPSEVLGSFTSLFVYNLEGVFMNKLNFPDNDSMYHYGFHLEKLSDGRLAVLGEVWRTYQNYEYDIFYAIINSTISGFDYLHYNNPVQNISNYSENLVASDNGVLGVFSSSIFSLYNLEGEFLKSFSLGSSSTCNVVSSTDQSDFYFNNHFYTLYYRGGSVNQGVSLLKYPNENGGCSLVFTENVNGSIFTSLTPAQLPRFTKKGKTVGNKHLIHGKFGSEIPIVISINDDEEVSLFYFDTTLADVLSLDFGYSSLDYNNQNHIYFSYFCKLNGVAGSLLYCIDNTGALKWKNFYPLNDELENDNFLPIYHIKALPNNDCIITVGVKGYLDKSDVYILRVDSNGNATNFVTSVNNVHDSAFNFNIYPNPAQNTLNIVAETETNFSVEIYNTIGQSFTIGNNIYYNEAKINIENLAKGIYFYQINNSKGEFLKLGKFLKE